MERTYGGVTISYAPPIVDKESIKDGIIQTSEDKAARDKVMHLIIEYYSQSKTG